MRPTYAALLPLAMAQSAMLRERHGLSPTEWAAGLAVEIERRPASAERDQLFSEAMQLVGVYVKGVKDFEHQTERYVQTAWESRARENMLDRMADDSRSTPVPWDRQSIKFVAERSRDSDLQQRVADRFRERDAQQRRHETALLPNRPDLAQVGNDQANRRASIVQAMNHWSDEDHVRLPEQFSASRPSLRDTVAAAMDMHNARALFEDPLMDDGLIGATDAA
ncbi:hypothetical protein [Mitsuaria sp. GD03876]|uniref:hypothetical protein n=1 Tax=Mitsuaria sp. GD03876 TaxID=2975399 RepID=UPI00244C96B6|nr:hypothetical protein [Mitsuaria sp. GD03876]MDH0866612.1 hypothetical protein [Mitsuaria sp. GD03876]